jgi:hypothetical protein
MIVLRFKIQIYAITALSMPTSLPNFLIASPPYNRIFAGVQVLHDLCHELNVIGYKAAIIFFHSGDGEEKPYQWSLSNRPDLYVEGHQRHQLPLDNPQKTIAEFLEKGIMIYPEIIKGNPIGAKRVARYLLVKDSKQYPGEFIVAFSKVFHKNPHYTLFKVTSPDFMNTSDAAHWSERKMDATYFGKGPKFVDCNLIPNTVLIERDWPRDQKQLAIMLKSTRFLFSFDGCSGIHTDAMLCGAVPVILHDKQLSREELHSSAEVKYPLLTLQNLQDKTTLEFDRNQLDTELFEFKKNFDFLKQSWQLRVADFASTCAKFFKLK